MDKRLFIVEDNQEIVDLLEKGLTGWGFSTASCQDFHQVATEVAAFAPDLVLMDVNLPFFNGFYWTQAIRKSSDLPIIFLSSRTEDADQIMAMNLGADDYMTKPFNLDLLIVKIQALLKRTEAQGGINSATLSFAGFALNILDNSLAFGKEQVSLSKNETKLLFPLFENAGQVVSKEELMSELWDDDLFVDRNTLSVMVNRIRTKTKSIAFDQHLQTIKGEGLVLHD
ncbi:response regulator transcription factor [Fructobacillus sp. M1-13]|uniref:Response regulator transcription factor n=1 Tax=Fructobacillus papyriferae TaxID=2713171 RepID=A0ABS5QPS5_9LACO|nr:response regulator transcription factor [Fructobacillus papyriferae]MBS9335184.1 response regulator transcription factor [Fructobacillus papyriferae]MCD2159147.1 response regulator transcription factor [Fructobacillus papyriferae]